LTKQQEEKVQKMFLEVKKKIYFYKTFSFPALFSSSFSLAANNFWRTLNHILIGLLYPKACCKKSGGIMGRLFPVIRP
jgi:hypothetical protein